MLTPQAIEDFKGFLDNNIAYAKVTVNGEAKKIPIHRRERLKRRAGGGLSEHYAAGGDGSDNSTGTALQQNKQLWADKTEDITLSNVQEGALYRFVFRFVEQEV